MKQKAMKMYSKNIPYELLFNSLYIYNKLMKKDCLDVLDLNLCFLAKKPWIFKCTHAL